MWMLILLLKSSHSWQALHFSDTTNKMYDFKSVFITNLNQTIYEYDDVQK